MSGTGLSDDILSPAHGEFLVPSHHPINPPGEEDVVKRAKDRAKPTA